MGSVPETFLFSVIYYKLDARSQIGAVPFLPKEDS